ncbi:MAG: EAL domain-containing protein [Moritella sp.]|uniref:bifunctional diguanylate cyclase/phosphodiesterase n=1 Tax=Moritella sp. TaxID=78556 RepID=UPI0029B163D5|nr:EAL domain-containing protein [Moritella sp.]MDX2319304.1 EAL domain-containing protein [Moritella sp.]
MPVIRPMVSRFIIILIVALIPAFTVMLFNIWYDFIAEKQKIRDEAFLFTEKVVTQQQNKIDYTKQILLNLAQDSALQDPADPRCSIFVSRIQRMNPLFTNIGVPLANGDLLCNALPLSEVVNVADRAYFRNTIENGLYSMSKFQHDRASELASMNFAVPVYDNDNKIIAAAVAVISLQWWNKQLTDSFFPKDGSAFVIDSHGQVIASHYGIGTAKENLAVIVANLDPQAEGVYEVKATDNIPYLVAYKQMIAGSRDTFVIIALPLESAYANAYVKLQQSILTLLFSLTTLSLILFLGLRAKIITPIYQLLEAVSHVIAEHFKYAEAVPNNRVLNNKFKHVQELSVISDHFNLVITEQKKQRQELKRLVYFDQLTQLPNRYALLNSIESRLSQHYAPFALVLIDIDNFGVLNDRFGHDIGDALLAGIANRLAVLCRDYEEVSRWCGDEFVFILPYSQRDLLENRIHCILESIATPIPVGAISHACQARCGVVLSQECQIKDASKLMDFADLAVEKTGDNKTHQINFFKPEMETAGHELFELEAELRHAISRDELCLHYQPIINLTTGTYGLAEALVRWQHPSRGLVQPLQFIELAEKTGLIIDIGRWVVCEALRQLALWNTDDRIDINEIAVNLSPLQLQDNTLLQIISEALIKHDVKAQQLTLEITESVLIDGGDEALAKISQFRAMGIKIALDDFGTGYSSLSYLSRFQLDKIKIDRSFVNEIGNARDDILIETIITMSHNMNLAVIAEGIEVSSQLEFLQQYDCEYGQGYYFSKPLAARAITAFFEKNKQESLC